MTEPTPNPAQQQLIENTDGIYVVDAGAGTGKTFAITHRYAEIVDQPAVEPEDVLLVTFTRSAATEMKERIVDHSTYSLRELADGSIQTFHSHCFDILQEHGYRAPTHLGLDERITGSTRVVEDELVENELFREFIDQFRDTHPGYADVFRALSAPLELLDVVSELASKGVFPTTEGWYRDGETALDGDFDAFKSLFDDVNQPRNDGRKQSRLRSKLNRYGRNKTYLPEAPAKAELRGDGTKQVPARVTELVFDEDREGLKAFIHDVYIEYLDFALGRNYLTFGFLQLFAFVLLCEDDVLRERVAYDYVMVDEFQDTSEIQFKLALLLAGTDNICVVGDWKQSIYSFQYADVDNIREFEARLDRFTDDLDEERERIQFEVDEIERIELTENYRSTQTVLDFSEEALVVPATDRDDVDDSVLNDVVSLSSNATFDNTTIEGVHDPDEHEAVLSTIQDVVGNEEYAVEDEDGHQRTPTYGDIAILTRTRDFGRELLTVADEYDFPMAYDGGIELFRTDQAKLLLAWLRILEADADRGWAVVLEQAGYVLDEIDHILNTGDYPANIATFRDELDERAAVGAVARAVFDRYGFSGEYADVILHTIQSVHESSTLTRGDLIRFIERGIENGSTHDVFTSAGVDSVTVQTIHSAKGLEYPIVVLANMNSGKFPPNGGGSSVIQYSEPVGLRQRKQYATVAEHPHVYDNWRHDVVRHCLSRDNDEERRLLYVAITRAESHVLFTGGEDPNTFFEELPCPTREADPTVETVDRTATAQTQLPFSIVQPDGPTGHTPHTLMDSNVFANDGTETEAVEFRGRDFGSRIHDFAEAYALGEDVTPAIDDADDERHVKAFLDSLPGELHVEERAVLPLEVDDERVTISGIVDLVHETPTEIEIIDFKTDRTRRGQPEYRKQLSAYYHVLLECFPDKTVTTSLFYTAEGEREFIEPLSQDRLRDLVRSVSMREQERN
ncbi:UvrD-helicase domain-containing protein [Natronomonas salsuginis]|uniref:DNA 3'-5' helicase n=1 Tax=Natronomonas salsuginis TaxID=2217661 RepID=A0A4U5JIS2_9EURY|nr:ATP-dependent DNA helicase [Natronomonas salsuginis]TKR27978.1 ATP-dependent helicase [Natronomonas salsuginis]